MTFVLSLYCKQVVFFISLKKKNVEFPTSRLLPGFLLIVKIDISFEKALQLCEKEIFCGGSPCTKTLVSKLSGFTGECELTLLFISDLTFPALTAGSLDHVVVLTSHTHFCYNLTNICFCGCIRFMIYILYDLLAVLLP